MGHFCVGVCAVVIVVASAIASDADGDAVLKACPGALEFARKQHDLGLQRDAAMGSVVLPKLQARLLEWVKSDQAVRNGLTVEIMADPLKAKRIMRRMHDVDERNYRRIKSVIDEFGFPTRKMVGGDGSGAAFLFVQHQTFHPEFQQFVLNIMAPLAKRGDVDQGQYALLLDRVLIEGQHKPQRYGTQFKLTGDRRMEMEPVEDIEHLDERRAELGLESIAIYRCTLDQYYHAPAP